MDPGIIKAGILTATDRFSKGEREDPNGILLKSLVDSLPAEVIAYRVVPDEKKTLIKALIHLTDLCACDLVLTAGGTGLGPRDNTPEATRQVIEKEIPGIMQAILEESLKWTPLAMLSRAVAGIRGKTLMINFPGSLDAIKDAFEVLRPILPHAIALLRNQTPHTPQPLHFLHS